MKIYPPVDTPESDREYLFRVASTGMFFINGWDRTNDREFPRFACCFADNFASLHQGVFV